MNIISIKVERSDQNVYCGVLGYIDENNLYGTLLWTFQVMNPTKIVVGFVQGDLPDWFDVAQRHANYLSDNIILNVAKCKNTMVAQPNKV